jgi:hypothetical protein
MHQLSYTFSEHDYEIFICNTPLDILASTMPRPESNARARVCIYHAYPGLSYCSCADILLQTTTLQPSESESVTN